jgi:methylglutaconyl-CoA hydratase
MSGVISRLDARGVLQLVFDRPALGNAFDAAMLAQMHAVISQADTDSQVRLLVLRGLGKHFCAGAQVGAPAPPEGAPRTRLVDVCDALHRCRVPVAALVHGACIGGGVGFIACCDHVLAAEGSTFSLPEARLGFAPGPLMTYLLRAIPARQLARHLLTGARFGLDEAVAMGLVHERLDARCADDEIPPALHEYLMAAPGAQATVRRLLCELPVGDTSAALVERLQQDLDGDQQGDEAREGRAAFAAKRPPAWQVAS